MDSLEGAGQRVGEASRGETTYGMADCRRQIWQRQRGKQVRHNGDCKAGGRELGIWLGRAYELSNGMGAQGRSQGIRGQGKIG